MEKSLASVPPTASFAETTSSLLGSMRKSSTNTKLAYGSSRKNSLKAGGRGISNAKTTKMQKEMINVLTIEIGLTTTGAIIPKVEMTMVTDLEGEKIINIRKGE